MTQVILIGDKIIATTGAPHPYEGVQGVVLASRKDRAADVIEHQVEFPRRQYTIEEMDHGDDKDEAENVVWFQAQEVVKI